MTTLTIADDHEILRDALASHATTSTDLEVVASVSDAQTAVNACRQHQPDVLLLDIEMPGRDSLASIPDILAASPETKIVILSAYCRDIFIEEALKNKVAGYLVKSDPPSVIFAALKKICDGKAVYSDAVLSRMSKNAKGEAKCDIEVTRLSRLSPREMEVLRYIGRGVDNGEMAKIMFLSKRTVERHVSRLMKSLDIHDRASLQKFATDQNITT